MRPYLAEFIGTFVLVLCGCGSTVQATELEQHSERTGIKLTEF